MNNDSKLFDMSSGGGAARGWTPETQEPGPLSFPTDMSKQFYPEAIKFSIYKRHGVKYDEIKAQAKKLANVGVNFITATHDYNMSLAKLRRLSNTSTISSMLSDNKEADQKKAEEEQAEQRKSLTDRVKAAEEAGKTGWDEVISNTTEIAKKAKEEGTVEKTQDRLVHSILLAMPESVNFAEGIDWQGSDLGIIGGLKAGALDKTNAIDYGILTGAGAALGGAAGLGASMIPGISGIAGTVVGAVLGGSSLQSGIESTFSVKTNPFKEQTFQGVGFRPFDFTFNFRARDQTDVDTIRKIITAFRSCSKPTFKDGSNGTIFKYPHEFRIEFLTFDDNDTYVTNTYLPEIKFCICQTVNTNFTAAGWRSFEGGAPSDITLQMTFQETEIITGEDVDGNTSFGRFKDYKGAGKGRF